MPLRKPSLIATKAEAHELPAIDLPWLMFSHVAQPKQTLLDFLTIV
jgi:hypothetical protein